MNTPSPSSPSRFAAGHDSAVDFPTPTRLHVAIAVQKVERSLPFYRSLFAQEPTKLRPGYAKFEVLDPPVNFTLNEGDWPKVEQGPRHFGVQVKSTGSVAEAKARMERAGFSTWIEEQVSCCYAVQDKVWVTDPDGHHWEIFVVTEADSERYERTPTQARTQAQGPAAESATPLAEGPACCAPSCCS